MLSDSYGDCPGFNCTHPVPSIASSAAAAAAGAAGRAGVVLAASPTNFGFPVQGVLQLIAELEGLVAELDPRLLFTCKRIFETLLLVQLLVSSNLFVKSVRIMASLTSAFSASTRSVCTYPFRCSTAWQDCQRNLSIQRAMSG